MHRVHVVAIRGAITGRLQKFAGPTLSFFLPSLDHFLLLLPSPLSSLVGELLYQNIRFPFRISSLLFFSVTLSRISPLYLPSQRISRVAVHTYNKILLPFSPREKAQRQFQDEDHEIVQEIIPCSVNSRASPPVSRIRKGTLHFFRYAYY